MAIDPSISLGVRSPQIDIQIPSPLEQYGRILTLRDMMQRGQLGQIELQSRMLGLQQLQRQIKEQEDYAAALKAYVDGRTAPPAGVAASIQPGTTQSTQPAIGPIAPPVSPNVAPWAVPGAPGGPQTAFAPTGPAVSPNVSPWAVPGEPASSLQTMMSPPAAPAAPVTQLPATGNPRLAGMTAAQFAARFPSIASAKMKEAFAADQAEAEAAIKQHDAAIGIADELGRAATAVRDSKDPARQFVTELTALANRGILPWDTVQKMVSDGYDAHKNDIDAFIVKAQNAKDRSETLKSNIAAAVDKRKLAREDYAQVNDQAGHDQFLQQYPEMRAALGDTFSTGVKDAFLGPAFLESQAKATEAAAKAKTATYESVAQDAALPTNQAEWDKFLSGVREPLRSKLPAQYSPAAQQLTIRALGVKPEPGKTMAYPPEVAAQKLEEERKKALVQADPFGLFTSTTPTGAAPGGAAGPSPLAQAISDFEGFGNAGSVAQRNHNPGNLRSGQGQTGTDAKGYAIFPDDNTGWAALESLIQQHAGQDLTLGEFFGGKKGVYPGYAPASDRNDPANYARTVAGRLGVDSTAKLSDIVGARSGTAPRLDPDTHGQAVLDALPPALAQQVKAMAEGRMKLPSGFALRSPYWQQVLNLVGQYDPSFDVNNPGKREATAKDFASGKSAQQVNALNTVIGHLESLSKSATALDNASIPVWNTFANWFNTETGDPRVKNFNTVKKAVVDELTRVWRGTGGSEKDIESWSESLDSSNSPAQMHSVIAQIGHLLESKLQALEDQYREGMGPISGGRQMITPQSRQMLNKLERNAGRTPSEPEAPSPAQNPNPNGYIRGHVYGGMTYLGGDPNQRSSWQ